MHMLSRWCTSFVQMWAAFDDDPPLLCGCEDGHPCDDCAPVLLAPS